MTVDSQNKTIIYRNDSFDNTVFAYGWYDEFPKEVRFGTTPQKVSKKFYKWLTSNAGKAP